MNKNDFKLISVILIIVAIFLSVIIFMDKSNNKVAKIYYENKVVLTIDLSVDKKYKVEGYNGIVNVVVKNNKIKVESENSPLHLCSNQGYISESYETIVCLPNKITIKIESSDNTLDTIVK